MDSAHATFHLADRSVFRLSGPDTDRYLNGQISQNINKATQHQAVPTCVTNAKGKLQGVGYIRRQGDAVILDAPAELRESLFQRLDMYLIADDVILEDVTDSYSIYHVLSGSTPEGTWRCNRFGIEGFDTLSKPDGELASDQVAEELRITNGIPAWGRELDDSILPPEALLDHNSISYNKGCYTGQEVISRMKSAGKLNRKLTAFELSGPLDTPCSIPQPDNPTAKPAGIITSLCSTENGYRGLGFLFRKWTEVKQFDINGVTLNTIDFNPVR